jgi:hypothetical protein
MFDATGTCCKQSQDTDFMERHHLVSQPEAGAQLEAANV